MVILQPTKAKATTMLELTIILQELLRLTAVPAMVLAVATADTQKLALVTVDSHASVFEDLQMVLTSVFWVVYLTHFSSSDLIWLEMVFERGLHWSDLTL